MTSLLDLFRALVVDQKDGATQAQVTHVVRKSLSDEPVIIAVTRSALNYKDALAVTGAGKILRSHPMIPGIELAGRVVTSRDPHWPVGSRVLVGGWGVGERYSGGYTEYFAAKSEWIEPLPASFDEDGAMTVGVAGITAMECIVRLRREGLGKAKPVLVTGATGGVGSLAIRLLAGLGYSVAAATGRPELEGYLRSLGATSIVPRQELAAQNKPLANERWGGAIDTIGGSVLAGLLSEMSLGASVAVVGLAASADLKTTVFPFILRGVNLLGIDSTRLPLDHRTELWREIAEIITPAELAGMRETVDLEGVPKRARALLDGKTHGRTIVRIAE
ncbi:MAG TPA: acryloyl-CoA reductase [Candidatus Baltobacteraceae bacterium]|jgi:acrylyl-CoA reductase (NADPH)|nr:acryloyl-CoA reductase [Candidatus Baltobacteraceae bacterium]